VRETWRDRNGRAWKVSESARALKFCIPAHAALRAEVHHRDGYACRQCGARSAQATEGYTGRYRLTTDTHLPDGSADALIVDHILTRRAGGTNRIENLQTLCETCNRRKQVEDKAAARRHTESLA
jgi:5-methylcytosine-specific restriction endonuclease McrA